MLGINQWITCELQTKGPIGKLLCSHDYTSFLITEIKGKHKKRHYYSCKRCGKKRYVD